jgi:hypothetical protein
VNQIVHAHRDAESRDASGFDRDVFRCDGYGPHVYMNERAREILTMLFGMAIGMSIHVHASRRLPRSREHEERAVITGA